MKHTKLEESASRGDKIVPEGKGDPTLAEQETAICEAVAKLSDDKLWSREELKPIYALSSWRWIADKELHRRRVERARRDVTTWADKEHAVASIYRSRSYDELLASLAKLDDVISEYDALQSSPTIRSFDPDLVLLQRSAELRILLLEHGVNPSLRHTLIGILTDFDVALHNTIMKGGPLDPFECELLEPIAEYLRHRELQNDFLTRHFTIRVIACLRMSVDKRAKFVKRLGNNSAWLLLFVVAAVFAGIHLVPLTFDQVFSSWLLCPLLLIGVFLFTGRWYLAGATADHILEQLYSGFGGLPLSYDGRELTSQLKRLQKLNVAVPSLLFSLFRITYPGYNQANN